MNVLMVGVDNTSLGGMLTVVENYLSNEKFCKDTNLQYLPVTTHAGKIKKLIFSLKAYLKIIKSIRKNRIDIIHVHMSDGGSAYREGLILWTAKRMGCKTISHMHAAEYEKWYNGLSPLKKKIVTFLLQKADVVIALGKDWKGIYENVTDYKSDVEVVYNAVNVPVSNLYNVNSQNVLFLAHMIKRKGIDDLLDAINIIRNHIPKEVKFILYGADRENNIAERIASRKLEGIVNYCGWLTAEEKTKCFCNTMINVLPSYNEGLPMTILETMSYGIPNISTNIAAIPEAVEDGKNGYLIEPGDIESLTERLISLINDSELRKKLSENAYQKAVNQFSLQTHLSHIIQIYNRLIQE